MSVGHLQPDMLQVIVCDLADIFVRDLSAVLEIFDFEDLRYAPTLRTFGFVNMSPTEFCD